LTEAHVLAFRAARVPRRWRPEVKWPWWKRLEGLSLVRFVLHHLDLALQWQASLPVALLVLMDRQKGKKVLLFDGRLWAKAAGERPEPIGWLISRRSERLVCQYDDASQFPRITLPSSLPPPTERPSLRRLLGFDDDDDVSFSDPQNLSDLQQCLKAHRSGGGGWDARDGGVTVVQGEDGDVCFSNGRQFVVEAKTDESCRIFYQDLVSRPVKPLRSPATSSEEEEEEEEEDENGSDCLNDLEDGRRMAEILRANRSAATSVCHSGLNLAFRLGVISLQEFHFLSLELGKTAASLALHLDERGHLRHIFYRDAESSFGQEVTCFEEKSEDKKEDECREKAVLNMNAFWNDVWNRRRIWGVPARAQILRDVLARLERLTVSSHSSPFDKCLRDLKRCVNLQCLVFFSSQEDQIHSIKFYLAHYACKVIGNQRGLQLKTSSDNNIYALVVAGQVSVFNVQAYVNAKEDAEFFDRNSWIPPPAISHSARNLQHQPAPHQTRRSMVSAVVSRARAVAFAHLEFWTRFGRDSVSFFGVDLHGNGQAFRSASLLAFESVWTRFIHLGGPLVQGPEKMKPHYAKMLRSASRGGFAFSARKFLDAGSRGSRRSIMEFDLSSAYGYSASNALMPSGFCTGFFRKTEEEEEEEEEGGGGG